jgi:hypothetical protein
VRICSERLSALFPYAILNFTRSVGIFSTEKLKITFVPSVVTFTFLNRGTITGVTGFSVTIRVVISFFETH